MHKTILRSLLLVLVLVLALAGCASVPRDRGHAEVADALSRRHGAPVALLAPGDDGLDAGVRASLDQPLDPDAAVALAWRLSPRVGTALAELGIAAGDAFDSQRPRNPRLSAKRMGSGDSTLGLAAALDDLIRLPQRRRLGEAHWQAAIAATTELLLDEALHVREDYFRYLGAIQVAQMREAVAEAAELSAELAGRFHAAGNISALQLAREEAAASAARVQAARTAADRLDARMALAERLGLAGRSNRWRLPEWLPLPPASDPDLDALLALAASERLDLATARVERDALADAAVGTRRLRGIGEVTAGVERERGGGERKTGPELEIELPLFNQGQGALARAEGRAAQAAQAVAQVEIGIEREVRSGLARLATLREIAAIHRDALIPLRETIVARQQERYNFMLIGVFELLAAKQQEYDAYQGYLEAIRDYWLAQARLARAVGGRLPGAGESTGRAPALDDLLQPEGAGGHDHHGHGSTP